MNQSRARTSCVATVIGLGFAIVALLVGHIYAQQPTSRLPSRVERIQLDGYSNPALGIVNDPLTEIVKIQSSLGWGTGTLLPECRVMTALHVLLSIKHGERTERLQEQESLVGERFEFESRHFAGNGRYTKGTLVVLGHGDLKGLNNESDSLEDWAIGYDSDCLSETLKLGYVQIAHGASFRVMEGQQFFTAGHSMIPQAKVNGEYRLYVDNKCGVSGDIRENRESSRNFIVTTCSVDGGGSGQLLLAPRVLNGALKIGINGRAQKVAHGIFLAHAFTDEYLKIPNVREPSGVGIFSDAWYYNFEPFLKGAVDLDKIIARGNRPSSLCDSLLMVGREAQERFTKKHTRRANDGLRIVNRAPTDLPSIDLSTLALSEPARCVVREPGRFSCEWPGRQSDQIHRDFETVAGEVQACFPTYSSTAKQSADGMSAFVDQELPDGVPGGPSMISVRRDRTGTSLVVRRTKDPRVAGLTEDIGLCKSLEEIGRGVRLTSSLVPEPEFKAPTFADVPVAAPSSCTVEKSIVGLSCDWSNRPASAARPDFNRLAGAISACFPAVKSSVLDGPSGEANFELTVPVGVRGGPSAIRVALDGRGSVKLSLQRSAPETQQSKPAPQATATPAPSGVSLPDLTGERLVRQSAQISVAEDLAILLKAARNELLPVADRDKLVGKVYTGWVQIAGVEMVDLSSWLVDTVPVEENPGRPVVLRLPIANSVLGTPQNERLRIRGTLVRIARSANGPLAEFKDVEVLSRQDDPALQQITPVTPEIKLPPMRDFREAIGDLDPTPAEEDLAVVVKAARNPALSAVDRDKLVGNVYTGWVQVGALDMTQAVSGIVDALPVEEKPGTPIKLRLTFEKLPLPQNEQVRVRATLTRITTSASGPVFEFNKVEVLSRR